jgi:sugar lactone lactonase YvrE
MLHQSPLCMGIAWDTGNVYWVFDGLNGHIVRYDFMSDHGPGGSDHSDGSTRRYLNATLTRREGVPGHMAVDHASDRLYVADTGAGRVMWLDTLSGEYNGPLEGNWDGIPDYSGWDSATWQPFASGLSSPSGLELADDRIFVGDYDSGEIIAYDMQGSELARLQTPAQGLMGITRGPDGKLWYADGDANEIVRIDP